MVAELRPGDFRFAGMAMLGRSGACDVNTKHTMPTTYTRKDGSSGSGVYPLREIQQSTVLLEMDGREGPRMPPGILRCRPPIGSC